MEPKNGDFAKYIEELSRKGARDALARAPASASASPGAVDTTPTLPPDPADAPGVVLSQRKLKRAPRVAVGHPTAAADADAANTQTLAQRADNQRSARVQILIGFVTAMIALVGLASAFDRQHGYAVPAIWGIVSLFAFRRAAKAAERARRPLREQPAFTPLRKA
ncbi:hypothetical protein CEK29_07790 [Bordetella genomosp. 5]|uniref:Uncharacterized protein n=1 Tax=Bordetella genomosp. 5 TaxID=1395608 RepID=A0A261TV25_9BORD|nr:hypothetical protein [Bordetella genomosp. 5]OZI44609.1 hypothetical protein CEK29_07790 [Bordetella genomosp. 5]OZI53509.1 hypothetical protein CAL25_05880 [Bordetella genomosp. 5]